MAANEILRFVVSRPAQIGLDKSRTLTTTKTFPDRPSALVTQVRAAADRTEGKKILRTWLDDPAHRPNPGDSAVMLTLVAHQLFSTTPRPAGDVGFKKFDDAATALGLATWRDAASVARVKTLREQLADRLLAQVLLGSPESQHAPETIRLFRAVELVLALALAGPAGLPRATVDRIMRTRPLLPDMTHREARRDVAPGGSRRIDDVTSRITDHKKERADLRQAIRELNDLTSRAEREDDEKSALLPEPKPKGFFGGPAVESRPPVRRWANEVSGATIAVIQLVVGNPQNQTLAGVIEEMEKRDQQMSKGFGAHHLTAGGPRLGLGPGTFGAGRFFFGASLVAPTGLDAAPTVPQGVGELGAPRRGDLVIVRQELARYQLGEIAHVENVLQGESHERSFARNQTSETVLSSSRDTATTEERDTQSTERFELSGAMKEAVSDHLQLEAGVSVSASYGPTVSVEANSQFGYDHAQEQSKEAASSFAREMSSSAKSKVETRVTEQRMSRTMTEVRELTRHTIDNSGGAGHVRGLYRWVDKVYTMQVVNYGIRDLYELYVPEPAAFVHHLNGNAVSNPIDEPEPVPPMVPDEGTGLLRPLTADDINEENYDDLVAQTGARDVAAPPVSSQLVSAVVQCSVDGDKPISSVNSELMIPDGYRSTALKFNGAGHKANADNFFWFVEISGRNLTGRNSDGGHVHRGDELEFAGRVGKVPFAVVSDGYDQLVVTLWVRCQRTATTLRTWQLNTYAAIMQGHQLQKAAYEERRAAATAERSAQIAGRAGAANLELIRNELKRAVITMMTAQRFERFDSMRPAADLDGYPEIALADARAEGRYVAFIEQAFEWENMTYVLYPYFWGRKADWSFTSQIADVDDRFAKFLRAGFARVQLPVRPGSEALVSFTFDPNNWSGDVWTQPDPPGFERQGTMTIEDEMQSQTGGIDHVQGPGRISIAANDTLITGVGTAFSEDDVDRELRVDRITYRVAEFIDPTSVRLEAPGPVVAVASALYSLGPKLVGLPWELTVPTTLVYLQADAALP
jgi:hypothetical protein